MKILFVLICLVLVLASVTPAQYIGYEYKGVNPETLLPNGVRHLGGALISDINKDPVYGISQVSNDKSRMLWLEVSTGQNESGVTGWRVLDVLSFSSLAETQHLLFAFDPAIECLRGSKSVDGLVASGTISRRLGIYKPQQAWIADVKNSKFKTTPTRGISCTYSEP
jgi:hypothetical protein